MSRVTRVPMGVRESVRWLSCRVSTVRRRCIRSWSVPKAAIEPTKPLRTASQTMLGSVSTRPQKSGAPGAGPQSMTCGRPARHGARYLARAAEAAREELVDGRAVVAVEGRDEQERHRELGQARPDEELAVLPVLAVGGRRHRDDRHRADLGGEEGQTGGPPRDAAPREEEVAGVSLLAGEGAADEEEGGERDEEDRVVGPGESAAGGSRGHGQRYYAPS